MRTLPPKIKGLEFTHHWQHPPPPGVLGVSPSTPRTQPGEVEQTPRLERDLVSLCCQQERVWKKRKSKPALGPPGRAVGEGNCAFVCSYITSGGLNMRPGSLTESIGRAGTDFTSLGEK